MKLPRIRHIKQTHLLTMDSLRMYRNSELYDHSLQYTEKVREYGRKINRKWEDEGLKKHRDCPICGSDDVEPWLDRRAINGNTYYMCRNCEFAYVNPSPPEEAYNEIYVSDYDGLLQWWSTKRDELSVSDIKGDIEEIARLKGGGLFLDYGCGNGWALKVASKHFNVYGLDINKVALSNARTLMGEDGGNIYDMRDIDLDRFKGKFDVIHTFQNIEHLQDPMQYLQKFYDWLKPGGLLYMACPASDSFAFSFLKEQNSMAALGHVSLFGKNSITYALDSAGFKDIRVRPNALDVTAIEFWKRIIGIDFIHRHSYIKSNILAALLYPPLFVTTAVLNALCLFDVLRGNYFSAFATKPDEES